MEGKKLATTRTESLMIAISTVAVIIIGILEGEVPNYIALLVFVSIAVTVFFSASRKRYSWIVTLFYYVFMIVLVLCSRNQIYPLSTITLLAEHIFLAFLAFSEDERLIHKIFL